MPDETATPRENQCAARTLCNRIISLDFRCGIEENCSALIASVRRVCREIEASISKHRVAMQEIETDTACFGRSSCGNPSNAIHPLRLSTARPKAATLDGKINVVRPRCRVLRRYTYAEID